MDGYGRTERQRLFYSHIRLTQNGRGQDKAVSVALSWSLKFSAKLRNCMFYSIEFFLQDGCVK